MGVVQKCDDGSLRCEVGRVRRQGPEAAANARGSRVWSAEPRTAATLCSNAARSSRYHRTTGHVSAGSPRKWYSNASDQTPNDAEAPSGKARAERPIVRASIACLGPIPVGRERVGRRGLS